jgi:hypothetical protein
MKNMTRTFSKRIEKSRTSLCPCGSTEYLDKVNPLAIIELDTLLISQRHLFRMPYSLHEKSGLSSVPIEPERILNFEKVAAQPQSVKTNIRFLDRSNVHINEAKQLFMQALDFSIEEEKNADQKEYEIPENAIPEKFFPPCIRKGLKGMEDGKKRFLFALTNFLRCAGWEYDKIYSLIEDWNKKNPETMREVYIKSQLRYHKQQNKRILPPNCRSFYQGIGICFPDSLCDKIKNPASYARRKTKFKH